MPVPEFLGFQVDIQLLAEIALSTDLLDVIA